MVVDDHPMWRDAVERDLPDAGFDVVASPRTAARRWPVPGLPPARGRPRPADPGANGVEVTAEVLRQDPSARVLILSAAVSRRTCSTR